MSRPPRPWRALLVGGEAWTVYVRPWLRRYYGFVLHDKKAVYLSGNQDPDDFEDTLLHEVLHACFAVAKVDYLLRLWSGGNERQADQREERLIRKLTPVLLVALKDLGWTPPVPPEE